LSDLPQELTHSNEGAGTWSPFDVLGHLIHGEKTDWIPRLQIMLGDAEEKTFEPFDRFAQQQDSQGKTLINLLDEFTELRTQNMVTMASMRLSEEGLSKEGIHPELGRVTVRQLLATWTAHDLSHVMQMSRVMAKQYRDEVGPWAQYMKVMQS